MPASNRRNDLPTRRRVPRGGTRDAHMQKGVWGHIRVRPIPEPDWEPGGMCRLAAQGRRSRTLWPAVRDRFSSAVTSDLLPSSHRDRSGAMGTGSQENRRRRWWQLTLQREGKGGAAAWKLRTSLTRGPHAGTLGAPGAEGQEIQRAASQERMAPPLTRNEAAMRPGQAVSSHADKQGRSLDCTLARGWAGEALTGGLQGWADGG